MIDSFLMKVTCRWFALIKASGRMLWKKCFVADLFYEESVCFSLVQLVRHAGCYIRVYFSLSKLLWFVSVCVFKMLNGNMDCGFENDTLSTQFHNHE